MSEIGRAVFLSYASQDAEATRKICDALRAAGLEVWFDQSELRGGDAWDQKIRRQIKDCALFVPIISVNTQSRPEGYFRLEWHLAEQRSHLIVRGRPFIVPVTIDQIDDTDALVPDAFLAVQWMRVPGGEATPAFCERVKALLTGEPEARSRERSGSRTEPSRPPLAPATKSRPIWLWVMLALIGALAAYLIFKPRRSPEEVAKLLSMAQTVVDHATAKPAAAPAPEVRALVLRVRTLLERTSRDTLDLAEELCKQAVQLDSNDAEAWAAYSLVSGSFVSMSYDNSAARYEAARSQADRAVKLAPDSTEALFALANSYRLKRATYPEAERQLRELVKRVPDEKRFLLMLGQILNQEGKGKEALEFFDRATALPGDDATAWYGRAQTLQTMGRAAEAEEAVDRSLARQPSGAAYLLKTDLLRIRGDLEEARAVLEKVPASILREPRGACVATYVWYMSREPEKMLAALSNMPGDYVSNNVYEGPKGWFVGLAHELAGRPEEARAEWRLAAQAIDQRLVNQPKAANLFYWKTDLLARLGEKDEASRSLHLYQQLQGRADSQMDESLIDIFIRLGRHRAVLDYLEEKMKRDPDRRLRDMLRVNPQLDPLRGNPRFKALLEEPATKQKPGTASGNRKPDAPEAKK